MASKKITITGKAKVSKNLNSQIKKMKTGARRGLLIAGAVIKTESIRRAPIDTSNLRASHFQYFGGDVPEPDWNSNDPGVDLSKLKAGHGRAMQTSKGLLGQKNHVVIIGASAFYALFVHEMPASNNFNSGGPKFLENAVSDNIKSITTIVKNAAKI